MIKEKFEDALQESYFDNNEVLKSAMFITVGQGPREAVHEGLNMSLAICN